MFKLNSWNYILSEKSSKTISNVIYLIACERKNKKHDFLLITVSISVNLE